METNIYIFIAIFILSNLNVNARNIMKTSNNYHIENDTYDDNSDEKEVVISSEAEINAGECDCQNGFCERNDKGDLVCKCPPEWGVYPATRSKNKCQKCDCGKGANCTYESGTWVTRKYCICKEGYTEVKGFCKGDCSKNPCKNGGTCKKTGDDISCICTASYSGDYCEKKKSSPCSSNPCRNGGSCNDATGKVVCECIGTFSGIFCETDLCSQKKCKNGGTCDMINGKPKCVCKPGFEGDSCESDLCSQKQCKNGGTCDIIHGTPKCVCIPGFEGDSCERDLCSQKQCKNGGRCVIINGKSKCVCKPGYEGDSCESDLCSQKQCKNGGTCNIINGKPKCFCKPGFEGDTCQTDPCTENPCQHGGTCFLSGYTFKCICKEAFAGEKCESSFSDIRYVLTLAALSLLIIIFSVLVTCLAFRSRCMSKE